MPITVDVHVICKIRVYNYLILQIFASKIHAVLVSPSAYNCNHHKHIKDAFLYREERVDLLDEESTHNASYAERRSCLNWVSKSNQPPKF
jgi:hypothetical protein